MDGLDTTETEEEIASPEPVQIQTAAPEPIESTPPEEPETPEPAPATATLEQLKPEEDEDGLDTTALDILAQELVKQPYDEAIDKLKKVYSENTWKDKEAAAQEFAKISHILNVRDTVNPEIKLNTDAVTLTQKIMSDSFSEDAKLQAIEDWRYNAKQKLYNTDDAESLVTATEQEDTIDNYALQLRRHIVAGDTNYILDSLARGAEAAITPLAGTFDLAFGTNTQKKLREYAEEHEDPEKDNGLISAFASGVGSVVGFAAADIIPGGALAYLGTVLADQSKNVYDTVLKETGSPDAAKNALLGSAPGIALGGLADRMIGGTLRKTLSSTIKGLKPGKGLGAVSGTLLGAGGIGAQSFITGKAMTEATQDPRFAPTLESVGIPALVGGVLGGTVGAYHDLSSGDLSVKNAYEQFKHTLRRSKESPADDGIDSSKTAEEFLDSTVATPGETEPGRKFAGIPEEKVNITGEETQAGPEAISADIGFQMLLQAGAPETELRSYINTFDQAYRIRDLLEQSIKPLTGEEFAKKEESLRQNIEDTKRFNDPDLTKSLEDYYTRWLEAQKEYLVSPEKVKEYETLEQQYTSLSKQLQIIMREAFGGKVSEDVMAQQSTPEETKSAAVDEIAKLVDESLRIQTELGSRYKPLNEKEAANFEDHIIASIKANRRLGNEDVALMMHRRLTDWLEAKKQYAANPEEAQRIGAQFKRVEDIRDAIVQLRLKSGAPLTPKQSDIVNVYGDQPAPSAGPTVLDAARRMSIRESIPESAKSPLQKVIPLVDHPFTPNPMVIHLTNKILRELTDPNNPLMVRLVDEAGMPNKFGSYNRQTHEILIRRQIFNDIEHARSTFAHELGHLLDSYNRTEAIKAQLQLPPSNDEPVMVKLLRLGKALEPIYSTDIGAAEARDISSQQRLGWDKAEPAPMAWKNAPPNSPEAEMYRYLTYRNSPNELHADVMSAILNRPDAIKAEFKNIWAAFEAGLEGQPILKKFWNDIVEMNRNPQKVSDFLREERIAGRKKQAEIMAADAKKRILERLIEKTKRRKDIPKDIKDTIINKYSIARENIDQWKTPAERELGEEMYSDLYQTAMSKSNQNALLNERMVHLYRELEALEKDFPSRSNSTDKIDPLTEFEDLLRITHVLEDTTETMFNVKQDPAGYREAGAVIQAEAADYYATLNQRSPLDTYKIDFTGLSGDKLNDAFAKMHLYLERPYRANIIRAINEKRGKKLTPADLKAIELLSEDAFNARKYMGNPSVLPDVELALMKERLGAENFKKLSQKADKFHDIIFDYLWPIIKKSEMYRPELERRIELNRRSYATMTAIKYFEKDPNITASMRKAVGNVNQMGDEWISTITKAEKIGDRVNFQISSNAAVRIAKKSKDAMTLIRPKVDLRYDKTGKMRAYVDSLYKTQKELQTEHPENSYLIETAGGESFLYEIKNPRWAKMFQNGKLEDMRVLGQGLSLLEDFNRIGIEREIKTALSIPFLFRSKFYDRSQEAMVAGSWEFPLWFHTSKPLRELKRIANQAVSDMQEGKVNKIIEEMTKYNAIPYHLTEEVGGYYNPMLKSQNMVAEHFGFKIPGEEELDIPLKINRALNKALNKIGFGKVRKAVETDELRAKVMMYLVGKNVKGMSDARAARLARELGGTPDPFGGGTEAKSINKLFLFGRAHINGLRGLYSFMKNDPKTFWLQYTYRKAMPRLLLSSALIGPLIGAMFGEEEEQIYRKFVDKIPSFDKLSKFCVPLGFVDDKNNYRFFNVKASEINQNWKAMYAAFPFSRDMITADTLMTPFFKTLEDYAETGAISAKDIARSSVQAFNSSFTAQAAPGIMSVLRIGQLASGGNPYDYYRGRGVLTKDMEESGTYLAKTYEYLLWSLNQTAPGMFTFNRDKQSSTEPISPWDYFADVPVAGATLKAFIRSSNYGDLEKYNELQQRKLERDADIRLSLKTESKKLYNSYRKAAAYVSRMGKDWAKYSTPEQIKKVHVLTNWHARAYRHGFNGMRAAFDNDDKQQLQNEAEKLERASEYVSTVLEQLYK